MAELPDIAVRLTAWLTLGGWALGEILRARSPARRAGAVRIVWSMGALLLLVHILVAFALRHHWSHSAAVADTARQTQEMFGLRWGGGVWINYGLTAWWWMDAIRLWVVPFPANRVGLYEPVRRGVFLFLWFNAAVVFAQGPSRILGGIACAGVVLGWMSRRRRERGYVERP